MNLTNLRSNRRVLIIAGSVVALIFVVVAGLLGIAQYKQNVRNEGVSLQRDIVTVERQFENGLSTCLDKSKIAGQITNQQYKAVKDILTAAVSARYVDANGNATRADATLGGGQFISVLHKQYPQIDVSTWKDFMSIAIGRRTDVQGLQDRMQHLAGEFDKWTQQGNIFNRGIRQEFPTDALKANDATKGGEEVKGRAALDYLTRVILTKSARDAIDSGIMPDQDLSGSSPAPSPTGR